ncbi:hypothetical protein D3C85_1495950 [compost metagenome]
MGFETGNGAKRMNPRLILFSAQRRAGITPGLVMLTGVQDAGNGKVHQRPLGAVEDVRRHPVAHAPRDEAATPDLTAHQSLALQLLIGVGDGLHADPHGVGHLPLRRQALVIGQGALFDIVGNGLHQNLVFGFTAAGEVQG